MAAIIADNIISPLGFSTQANYQAVKAGKTALQHYDDALGIPFPFTASLFSEEQKKEFTIDGLTLFESLAVTSIRKALESCQIHLDKRTCLIISSTKQNISLLTTDSNPSENITCPGLSAEKIAKAVGITTTPIIVCNACRDSKTLLSYEENLRETIREVCPERAEEIISLRNYYGSFGDTLRYSSFQVIS